MRGEDVKVYRSVKVCEGVQEEGMGWDVRVLWDV